MMMMMRIDDREDNKQSALLNASVSWGRLFNHLSLLRMDTMLQRQDMMSDDDGGDDGDGGDADDGGDGGDEDYENNDDGGCPRYISKMF